MVSTKAKIALAIAVSLVLILTTYNGIHGLVTEGAEVSESTPESSSGGAGDGSSISGSTGSDSDTGGDGA